MAISINGDKVVAVLIGGTWIDAETGSFRRSGEGFTFVERNSDDPGRQVIGLTAHLQAVRYAGTGSSPPEVNVH